MSSEPKYVSEGDVLFYDKWDDPYIFNLQDNRYVLDKLSQIRLNLFSLQHAKVGPGWGSEGRKRTSHFHYAHFVVDGAAEVFHNGKTLELLPGNVYWLPAYCPVECSCEKMYDHYFIMFRWEWMNGIDLFATGRSPMRLGTWKSSEFADEWRKRPLPLQAYWRLQAFMQKLFAENIRDLDEILRHQYDLYARFRRVFDYIDKNISNELDVSHLANLMGLSRGSFSKTFKDSFDISPKTFINQRLNQRALDMVICSDLRMNEIAGKLGFRDEYYFNRFFSKMNDIPPLQYRKQFLFQNNPSGRKK